MRSKFELNGKTYALSAVRSGGGMQLQIDGQNVHAQLRDLGHGERIVAIGGKPMRIWIAANGSEIFVHAAGRAWTVRPIDDMAASAGSGAGIDTVAAPMPGVVVAVNVKPGDAIKRGDALVVIESMKLETALKAPRDGVVAETPFAKGATVEKGAILARLVAEAGDSAPDTPTDK
ncbi:MAG: biotin/lipoyl-containing protein [Alphaproteobacteria bacterium]